VVVDWVIEKPFITNFYSLIGIVFEGKLVV
jgi:hypothetical protein